MFLRSNPRLRERLAEITSTGDALVDSHPQLIADLAREISHSIELAPDVPGLPIRSYNCFEFALGLAGRREVRLISRHLPSTFCNGDFVQNLVDSMLIPTTSSSTGALILYRNHAEIAHAGLVSGSRVISKWGTGHLWLHALLEVPVSYGDGTSFYAAPSMNDMLNCFIEYARSREGRELVNSILDFEP